MGKVRKMAKERAIRSAIYRNLKVELPLLLVRIHFIIETIRWTGLAPWEFEFPFLGSLTSSVKMSKRVPMPVTFGF